MPKTSEEKKPLLDDGQILARVRDGDPGAATALYRRLRPAVDASIARILGRHDRDHDDLVQISLIEVVRSLPRFRGDCSLDTWTSRIAARVVFNELRSRTSRNRIFSGETADIPSDARLDETLSARSTLARVRTHLDAMSPVKAFTVILHDVCEYDLREIAEITESTVAAAQSRLVRGRQELHERLESDPELCSQLRRKGTP